MGWPNEANGSETSLILMLGEAVANSRHLILDVREIRRSLSDGAVRMERLEKADINHQNDITNLRREMRHGRGRPVKKRRMFGCNFAALAEMAETAGAWFKVLTTLRETAVWLLSGTLIYQLWAWPVWVKQWANAILAAIGLSS